MEFLVGALKDIKESGVIAHVDAEVLGGACHHDLVPTNHVESRSKFLNDTSGDRYRFGHINEETCVFTKYLEALPYGRELRDEVVVANRSVVSIESNGLASCLVEHIKEDLDDQNKQGRGKGAPLLDPGAEVDASGVGGVGGGVAVGFVEEPFDGVPVARIKANLLQDLENCFVSHRIKSFLEVNEKDVVDGTFIPGRVKLLIEKGDIVFNREREVFPEAGLEPGNNSVDSRCDAIVQYG